ncbi:MAG: protein-tyrosine-phosphatase [Flavobacteriales bacterium]
MIPLALALSLVSPPPAMPHRIHPEIQQYVDQHVIPAMAAIPAERKESLDLIAAFIRERRDTSATADLTFICTHNSRRSILSQVWAATAACAFGLDHVRTFSGGTEATAFNPRAIEALRRAGFHVAVPEGKNPRCTVAISKERATEPCWSKRYDDPANPQQGFCAVMTCSEADKNCPIVLGALDRISLPYRDPKEADGTSEETARYDERCLQIAAEMWYVMRQVVGSK